MSITEAFDSGPALIEPRQLAPPVEDMPQVLIVAYQEKVRNFFLESMNMRQIAGIRCGLLHPVYAFAWENKTLGFLCSPIGGAAAVLTAEKAAAMGVDQCVFFGSCGTIGEQVLPDTFFIPTQAYRDEGASYHYAPPSDYIDVGGAAETEGMFRRRGVGYTAGRVWTTDAFFRETPGKAQLRRQEGCLAVDMECASIAALCRFRGLGLRYFLFAADCASQGRWSQNNLHNTPAALISAAALMALSLACSM